MEEGQGFFQFKVVLREILVVGIAEFVYFRDWFVLMEFRFANKTVNVSIAYPPTQ